MPLVRRLCLAIVVGGVLFLVGAPAATASCGPDGGPEGSDIIFVGTAEENRRGYTRFGVSEVLAGPTLAPEVWVLSGTKQRPWPFSIFGGVSSSVDADFVVGEHYVVGSGLGFVTNACSSEALTGEGQLRQLRTPTAGPPQSGGLEGADPPMDAVATSLAIAAGLAALLALGLTLRWHRSTPQ